MFLKPNPQARSLETLKDGPQELPILFWGSLLQLEQNIPQNPNVIIKVPTFSPKHDPKAPNPRRTVVPLLIPLCHP